MPYYAACMGKRFTVKVSSKGQIRRLDVELFHRAVARTIIKRLDQTVPETMGAPLEVPTIAGDLIRAGSGRSKTNLSGRLRTAGNGP